MSADGTPDGGDAAAIERQLDAIRDKRAALAAQREQRAQPTAAELLAIEQRKLAEDEALDQMLAEHGRLGEAIEIIRARDDVGAVIVRRPHLAVWRRFQDASGGKDAGQALDQLVRPCVVYPSKAEFDQLVARLPFLLQLCADACARLAGVRVEQAQAKP